MRKIFCIKLKKYTFTNDHYKDPGQNNVSTNQPQGEALLFLLKERTKRFFCINDRDWNKNGNHCFFLHRVYNVSEFRRKYIFFCKWWRVISILGNKMNLISPNLTKSSVCFHCSFIHLSKTLKRGTISLPLFGHS